MSSFGAWYFRRLATLSTLLRRPQAALGYWERVHELSPEDTRVLATISFLKADRGSREEAVALLRQALERDPDNASWWFNLGFLQQEGEEHAEALDSFDRALALDDKLDRAWYGKALSLIRLGRLQEAIAPLKKNTELQPMSPYGWYQLAHVYHRLGDHERVARVIGRLSSFEPQVARQLERETGADVGLDIPFR